MFAGIKSRELRLNGCGFKPNYLRDHSVFVRAGDLFHDTFTAKEILEYEAMFRVKGPSSHRAQVVERVIKDFQL